MSNQTKYYEISLETARDVLLAFRQNCVDDPSDYPSTYTFRKIREVDFVMPSLENAIKSSDASIIKAPRYDDGLINRDELIAVVAERFSLDIEAYHKDEQRKAAAVLKARDEAYYSSDSKTTDMYRKAWSIEQLVAAVDAKAKEVHETTEFMLIDQAGPRALGAQKTEDPWLEIKRIAHHLLDSKSPVGPFSPPAASKELSLDKLSEWVEDQIAGQAPQINRVVFTQQADGSFISLGLVSTETKKQFAKLLKQLGLPTSHQISDRAEDGVVCEASTLAALYEKGVHPMAIKPKDQTHFESALPLTLPVATLLIGHFEGRGIEPKEGQAEVKGEGNNYKVVIPTNMVVGLHGNLGHTPLFTKPLSTEQTAGDARSALSGLLRKAAKLFGKDV